MKKLLFFVFLFVFSSVGMAKGGQNQSKGKETFRFESLPVSADQLATVSLDRMKDLAEENATCAIRATGIYHIGTRYTWDTTTTLVCSDPRGLKVEMREFSAALNLSDRSNKHRIDTTKISGRVPAAGSDDNAVVSLRTATDKDTGWTFRCLSNNGSHLGRETRRTQSVVRRKDGTIVYWWESYEMEVKK
jgi:hypothetical protein